jgi:hypothetical protein
MAHIALVVGTIASLIGILNAIWTLRLHLIRKYENEHGPLTIEQMEIRARSAISARPGHKWYTLRFSNRIETWYFYPDRENPDKSQWLRAVENPQEMPKPPPRGMPEKFQEPFQRPPI